MRFNPTFSTNAPDEVVVSLSKSVRWFGQHPHCNVDRRELNILCKEEDGFYTCCGAGYSGLLGRLEGPHGDDLSSWLQLKLIEAGYEVYGKKEYFCYLDSQDDGCVHGEITISGYDSSSEVEEKFAKWLEPAIEDTQLPRP